MQTAVATLGAMSPPGPKQELVSQIQEPPGSLVLGLVFNASLEFRKVTIEGESAIEHILLCMLSVQCFILLWHICISKAACKKYRMKNNPTSAPKTALPKNQNPILFSFSNS